jgi:hypothetical protein
MRMSAPQTNIERQKRRHAGPLLGMLAGVGFVALLFIGYVGYLSVNGQTSQDPAVQVDGRTGETVETE